MAFIKRVKFVDIYIFLWILYSMQEMLLGRVGTILAKLILVFLLVSSVFYTFYASYNYKLPKYFRGLTLLLVMFVVYGLLLLVDNNRVVSNGSAYLRNIFVSLIPIYPCYVFARRGELNKNKLIVWSVLFFLMTIMSFFFNQNKMLAAAIEQEEFTNNIGYVFLSLIPLLVFFDTKILRYVGLFLCVYFIVMGMKRGAILIGLIISIIFIKSDLKTSSKKEKRIVVLLSVGVILSSVYLVQYLLDNSLYFNYRVEQTSEGYSSGRDVIYKTLINHYFTESNAWQFFFGNGAESTLKFSSHRAHNDWLEIAINQGLIGIIIYIFYWSCFYETWKSCKYDGKLSLSLGLILIIYLMRTVFSMSYNDMNIYSTVCLGYCLGMIGNQSQGTESLTKL